MLLLVKRAFRLIPVVLLVVGRALAGIKLGYLVVIRWVGKKKFLVGFWKFLLASVLGVWLDGSLPSITYLPQCCPPIGAADC